MMLMIIMMMMIMMMSAAFTVGETNRHLSEGRLPCCLLLFCFCVADKRLLIPANQQKLLVA